MANASVRALLSNRRFALYLCSRLSLIIATQMLSVAVGWQVYEITGAALALGFSGLAIFVPGFLLALPGGAVADRRDRRSILLVCHVGVVVCAVLLGLLSLRGTRSLGAIYAVLALLGTNRAFSGPAGQALMPNLVARADLERAVALSSSTWQLAMIAGPSLGGVIYAATGHAYVVYGACAAMAVLAFVSILAMGNAPREAAPGEAALERPRPPARWSTLVAGIGYVWSNKPILGAISLDLFAVLLGGAVALLPIYAKDYLHAGPWGLGLLRSATAVGAAVVALTVAYVPIRRRAGVTMLACVLLFGVATIVFGVSRSFPVSLLALLVLGGSDMISVVIRSTLIQTRTPDEMRGRVGAVNLVFIGASNELGEFESGLTAAWLGPELSVVLGGVGTCLIVLLWAVFFPGLRDVDRADRVSEPPKDTGA